MDGLFFIGGPSALTDRLASILAHGEDGLDAAIIAVAEAAQKNMKGVLEGQGSHSRGTPTPASPGGPPAQVTGTLAKSVAKAVKVKKGGATAFIGPTKPADEAFYGRFLQRGYVPNGGKRRTRAQRRSRGTSGKVRYPYVEKARDLTIAEAGPIAAEAVGLTLRGVR